MNEITLIEAIFLVLAAARLTRLAVVDTIGFPLRVIEFHTANAVSRIVSIFMPDMRVAAKEGSYGEELIGCPHCTGFWMSLVVVAAWATATASWSWTIPVLVFGVAYAAGHLVARMD